MPKVARKWFQSDQKVARLAPLQTFSGVLVAALTLQKCFKNQWFLTFPLFDPTKPVHTCMGHALHMKFDVYMLKVTPK